MTPNGYTIVFRLKSNRALLSSASVPNTRVQLLARLGAEPVFRDRSPLGLDAQGIKQIYVVPGGDFEHTAQLLEELEGNEQVEFAYVAPPRDVLQVAAPPDPCRAWKEQIRLDTAKALPQWQGKHKVTVAVVDSGVDRAHPQLGHVELVNHQLPDAPPQADRLGHGTHVAGLITAEFARDNNFDGICDNPIQVTVHNGMAYPRQPDPYYRALRACIGARVVNLSVGGEGEDLLETELVKAALDAGSIVIAAIGNHRPQGSPPIYPAEIDGVIAVAAVDENNEQAETSNDSFSVAVSAPGVDIWSTVPTYALPDVPSAGAPPLGPMSGTSMATPIVTGVVAKMLAYQPALDRAQVIELLTEVNGTRGNPYLGIGVIDVHATLAQL